MAFIVATALVLPSGFAVAQAVIHVDDDASPGGDGATWATAYNSLSTALATAQPGDQIWTAAGTYVGNFTLTLSVELYGGFDGTETELTQRDWTANRTILDGNASGSVVTAPPGATATTRIDGFTITNGWTSEGGGMLLVSSSPTITNNLIAVNGASDDGGGLYLDNSSPAIVRNTIIGNTVILGNGGGMVLLSSSPTIVNNIISGNFTYHRGGGLYLASSAPTIANNTITGNGADWYGGGVCLENSSPTVTNNTVTGNAAGRGAGGLYLAGSPTVVNTIVAFNSSGVYRVGGTAALRSNCVYGNGAYDYLGIADPTGTDGNISADPRLGDPRHGNVRIHPDSPCVAAGSNADAWGARDIDGEPRIQPLGGTVDIGADESDGTVPAKGPYTIVRVSNTGDDYNDGSSWPLAKRTVQGGIDAASAMGGEVWVAGGTYEECIALRPYAYVYGGFGGFETARQERDHLVNVTILDARQQGSVVTARAGHGVLGRVDGFIMTGGLAPDGGGLLLRNPSPTIANNIITDNAADYNGGGLYVEACSPTVANNTIRNNAADYGGGLYLAASSATISNCAIASNGAANAGGGLCLTSAAATIRNSTMTDNTAGTGGALYLAGSGATIANTIVAFNSSGAFLAYGNPPALQYDCVFGNTQYDYSGIADPAGIAGNISADPMFARLPDPGLDGEWGTGDDDVGDLQLLAGSPCVDTGDNAAVPADAADLDGDGETDESVPIDLAGSLRFVDDPNAPDTGAGAPPIVDMGAYERLPGDCGGEGGMARDGALNLADYAGFGLCVVAADVQPPELCQCFDLDGSGLVDLPDFAVFQVTFTGGGQQE